VTEKKVLKYFGETFYIFSKTFFAQKFDRNLFSAVSAIFEHRLMIYNFTLCKFYFAKIVWSFCCYQNLQASVILLSVVAPDIDLN
jgi:hypothetical protein